MAVRLRTIYTYLKFGKREFFTGDGYLSSLTVTLGEDERAHTCSFTIADPQLKIGNALFKQSFDQGGIAVPLDLLEPPPPPASASGDGTQAQIFENLADLPGDGQIIINECGKQGIVGIAQLAYIMATVQRETGTYKPVKEIGGSSAYYAPYFGRGYVQLTHDTNYAKYSKLTGKNLTGNPDLALEPSTAAFILAHGFKTGNFTGRKLRDYISDDGSKKDFMNARRIINGTDKAALIAGYAREWEVKLQGLTLKPKGEAAAPANPPSPPAKSSTGPIALQDAAASAPKEISEKGTEIIIGLGEAFENLVDFHFIHTGTDLKIRPNLLSIRGQAIRWLLSRRKTNTTYKSVSLREVAQRVCDKHGLRLEMDGDGPKYAYLDQSGLSDFGLLYRECQAVGFRVSEKGNTLQIGPIRPQFTGFVIEPWMVVGDSLSFSDKASADMPANRSPSGSATDPKAEIDPQTGDMQQVKKEDSRGTGDRAVALERVGEALAKSLNVTGNAKPPLYGTIAVSDAEAALPSQATGAIALSTGEVIQAEALKTELQRVKGYESSVTLKMTAVTLTLVPGSVIAIAPSVCGSTLAREFRVGTVTHSVSADAVPTTQLDIYTPQTAIAPKKDAAAGDGTGAGGSDQTVSESGWLRPTSGVLTSDFRSRNPGRPRHFGVDLSGGEGTPIYCAKDGEVVDVVNNCRIGDTSCGGRFGNRVYIQSGQYVHRYAHMQSKISLRVGDKIKQGALVGYESNTGDSRGSHLHWEVREGATAVDPAKFIKL